MKRLRDLLDNGLTVSFPRDVNGYIGRECPVENCKRYFKIKPGTGLKGEDLPLHCPYCGHEGRIEDFHTKEQTEYAFSVLERSVHEAAERDVRDMVKSFNRGAAGSICSVTMDVKSSPVDLRRYVERDLETDVVCQNCSLEYSVYGVFSFCPDCRNHNSLNILSKSLEVVSKMLDVAGTVDQELGDRLIENALEDCVSAFDGFGRELCRVHAKESSDPDKAENISFQNLPKARQKALRLFHVDLTAALTANEWQAAAQSFQKRHLLSHKMGVVDDEYVRRTGDTQAVVGRKISIEMDEVRDTVRIVLSLASHLSKHIGRPFQSVESQS